VVARGRVRTLTRDSASGFDVGTAMVDGDGSPVELAFCNEYMTVERAGRRLFTFPDLIVVLGRETGAPVSVAELAPEQEVVVVTVDRRHVMLGAGVWDPTVYPEIEAVMGKDIARYALVRPEGP
jgi:DUF917 family protein